MSGNYIQVQASLADQVAEYEASGGTGEHAARYRYSRHHCHNEGVKTGAKITRRELARGCYSLIASQGGAPTHPGWYYNLLADQSVMIQMASPSAFTVKKSVARGALLGGNVRLRLCTIS